MVNRACIRDKQQRLNNTKGHPALKTDGSLSGDCLIMPTGTRSSAAAPSASNVSSTSASLSSEARSNVLDQCPLELVSELHSDVIRELQKLFGTGRPAGRRCTRTRNGTSEPCQKSTGIAVVLHGMSGVGKSSLAQIYTEQARQRGHYRRGVHHLNLSSPEMLLASVKALWQHPEFSLAPPTCDVTSERFWRAALPQQFLTSGVLLVVDNADTPSDLGINGQYSVMWSNLLPSAHRHHNLLVITQCSVLPNNLVRCITGQLEVLPLSVLQTGWMFARLTRRLCPHASQPSSWRMLCESMQPRCIDSMRHTSSKPHASCRGEYIPELAVETASVPVSFIDSERPCCTKMQHLAQKCTAMHGLPIIICLEAAQFAYLLPDVDEDKIDLIKPGEQEETATSSRWNSAACAERLHDVWYTHYSNLSQPAKQLLSILAFLHPDQIYIHMLLWEEHHWMPAELYSFAVGQSSRGNDEDLKNIHHNISMLVAELRMHSLVVYGCKRWHEGDLYQEQTVSLHRSVRHCTLVHLLQCSKRFLYFLGRAVYLLNVSLVHSPSISYLESCIVPHIVSISTSRFLRSLPSLLPSETSGFSDIHSFIAKLDIQPCPEVSSILSSWSNLFLLYCHLFRDLVSLQEYQVMWEDAGMLVNYSKSESLLQYYGRYLLREEIQRNGLNLILGFLLSNRGEHVKPLLVKLWLQVRHHCVSKMTTKVALDNINVSLPANMKLARSEVLCLYQNYTEFGLSAGNLLESFVFSDGNLKSCHTELEKHGLERKMKVSLLLSIVSLDAAFVKSSTAWMQARGITKRDTYAGPCVLDFFADSHSELCSDAEEALRRSGITVNSRQTIDYWPGQACRDSISNRLRRKRSFCECVIFCIIFMTTRHKASYVMYNACMPLAAMALCAICSQQLTAGRVNWQRSVCFLTDRYEHMFMLLQTALFGAFLKDPPYFWLDEESYC